MVSVVIARHEPAPRRRRPWHAQKPSAREPGDLHRCPHQSWPGPRRERAGGVEFQLRLSEFVARLQAPIGRGERWEVRHGEYRCEKISMRVGYAA